MPEIQLPTFHPGQVEIFKSRSKLNAVRCGRRWGKTTMMIVMAANGAAKGRKVAVCAPEYRQLNEPYRELLSILMPIKEQASRTAGTIRTKTGGVVDFWPLNDNLLAGRGREYDLILIDEAAWTKTPQMNEIWEKSLKPTMLTRPKGQAWFFSTPSGNDAENLFWRACHNEGEAFQDFSQHYAPTSTNPLVPPAELERERERNQPLVFQQEYLAEFVDWSGVAFFSLDKLLVDGQPIELPNTCDSVFAVIDTAVKGGKEHDATACSWWAHTTFRGPPLILLDWELIQIDAALLERWMPSVLARGEELARTCGARFGFPTAWIEDAQSGSVLLQQCAARGFPVDALPEKMTAIGKDERAINASGPVYRGEVKFSRPAYDKVMQFKGTSRNHMVSQVVGFRIGDKDAAKRADDLLDTFTYAVALALGNSEGFA